MADLFTQYSVLNCFKTSSGRVSSLSIESSRFRNLSQDSSRRAFNVFPEGSGQKNCLVGKNFGDEMKSGIDI